MWTFNALRAGNIRSSGGVVLVASLQIVVALILLAIYERFKVTFFNDVIQNQIMQQKEQARAIGHEAVAHEIDMGALSSTPMDYLFWVCICSNIASILGIAGVLNQQRELVTVFFAYSAVQMVVVFHYFVDSMAEMSVTLPEDMSVGISGPQKAAAAFLFLNLAFSAWAVAGAVRAYDEIRLKQREEYRLSDSKGVFNLQAETTA